ncbi:MobA/MobL family protein [Jeotgalibacillus sp. ET6]|uniref:MobA/MobL family protein n=1 Tax=Jeotgalibacillus sp. ET6 TaxID=3037260 RepID=UPI002418B57F|nr:MobA/MobL family protein [Jeotgalibacillus sp. ET6]MDG5473924.1 MobA/MobL family protein [Jeotgalibacillus sp. ET6]
MKEKIFHLSVRNISRVKYNVPDRFSYNVGIEIKDEKINKKYHRPAKAAKDEIESEMILNAAADRKFKDINTYYNEANKNEKRLDARVFKECDVCLYTDLTEEENKELARRFTKDMSERFQTPISLSFHKLDSDNPHFHLLHSERKVNGTEFDKKKMDEMRKKTYLKDIRKMWAEHSNEFFKEKNKELFVDHRSHKIRKIEKDPLLHQNNFGPKTEKERIKQYNHLIKIERQIQENKELKKEVKENYYAKRIDRNLQRKEVKNVEKAKVLTVHRLYENEIQKHQKDYLDKRNQHKAQREKNKQHKQVFVERKMDYKENRSKSKNNVRLKKQDIIDMKYKNKDLKADLKGLSIFDRKKRRDLRKEITKNKIKMKKKKVEIKREKYKQKEMSRKMNGHRKELHKVKKKEFGLLKDKMVSKIKFKSLSREKQKVVNKKLENTNVISLKDFKKTQKVQKIKTIDRARAR